MDERDANIDLLFRNGLKDYEVLPPAEVWNKIHPSILRRSRNPAFLRYAAVMAALVLCGYMVYRLNNRIYSSNGNSTIALNITKPVPISQVDAPPVRMAISQPHVKTQEDSPSSAVNEAIPVREESVSGPGVIVFKGKEQSLLMPGNSDSKQLINISTDNSFRVTDSYFLDNPEPAAGSRWSLMALASPTYYSAFGNNAAKKLMSLEQSAKSYSGGLSVSYKINRKLTLQTGVYYASNGQKIDGINSFEGFQKYYVAKGDHNFEVSTSSGPVYTSNNDLFLSSAPDDQRLITNYTSDIFDPRKANMEYLNNSIIQNFSYVELPVLLRYKFIDKTIDLSFVGGLSYDVLVNNSVYASTVGGKVEVGKTQDVNPLSLSSSLGMGFEYNFSQKISFNLEPTVRYYLNPFMGTSGPVAHPYFFGIFSGLSYKF